MTGQARVEHSNKAAKLGLQPFSYKASAGTGERYPLCLDDSEGRQCTGLVYANHQCFRHFQGWSREDVAGRL